MEMPTLKLARILFSENNLLFKDIEDARNVLRKIEGKSGNTNRYKQTHKMEEARSKNPYNLPESDESIYEPFIISGHKHIGLISDIHIPYHSISCITCAIDKYIQVGIDALILNGDIIDALKLSKYEKDPRLRSFSEELEALAEFMVSLKEALPGVKIYYKIGNHEERVDDFIYRKAHELVGVPEFSLNELIRKRVGDDVDIIGDKRVIHVNELDIIHGHEFSQGFFSPVNVARGLSLRAKTNAIQGHNHQVSEHTETDLRGRLKTTWSLGCACELNPKYMPINKWSHGFATVEVDTNKTDFHVNNYRVKNGRIL